LAKEGRTHLTSPAEDEELGTEEDGEESDATEDALATLLLEHGLIDLDGSVERLDGEPSLQ